MPKISVVMSVYKEPVEWMRQSIDSILNQTYTDFEFIIINDKPDREENVQLLNEYANRDNRIRIITNEENIGLTKSLNKGISIAQGEYIARMDADDISMPERFEKQISYLALHSECVALGTAAVFINDNGDKVGNLNVCLGDKKIRSLCLFVSPIVHPSVIFKKTINGVITKYNTTYRYAQDYELWCTLSKEVINNLPDVLMQYRKSNKQISNANRLEQLYYTRSIVKKNWMLHGMELDDVDISNLMSLQYENDRADYQSIYVTIAKIISMAKDKKDLNLEFIKRLLCFSLFKRLRKEDNFIKFMKRFLKIRYESKLDLYIMIYYAIVVWIRIKE